uniref:Male-enhanced antigen 1 n=1 Tax=Monopterus albus TaxID=43700 RepID=A0A3Q3J8E7_MONAL
MEVWSSVMGPERVLPSSEEELGEDQRPADGALLPVGAVWSGDMELDVEEEEEEVSSGGYYYQPLNQDPDGVNGTEQPEDEEEEQSHVEQLQQVQHQIEVSSLLGGKAPGVDEIHPEYLNVVSPFPVRSDHVELVKRTMATVALPSLGVPAWAQEISDDQWKDMVQHTLQSRQSASALRLSHRGDP